MTKSVDIQVKNILASVSGAIDVGMTKGVMRAASNAAGEIAEVLGPGALARSFTATPVEVGPAGGVMSWAASRGSARRYAGIQDEGGTIYPRNMKRLAVPIGTARIAKGKWPRHFGRGELKFMPRPGRPPLLVKELTGRKVVARRRQGKIYRTWVKAIQPMFVLLPSVDIPPKRYLAAALPAVNAATPGIINAAIEEARAKKGGK